MQNLLLINNFLKAPITDKLFRRYVKNRRARQIFYTSIRVMEIAMITVPLAAVAVRTIREAVKPVCTKRRSFLRRMLSA